MTDDQHNDNQRRILASVPRNEYDAALSVITNKIDTIEASNAKGIKSSRNKNEIKLFSKILKQIQDVVEPDSNFAKRRGNYDTPTKELIQKAMAIESLGEDEQECDDDISVSSCSNADDALSIDMKNSSDNSDEDDEDEIMDEEDLIDEETLKRAKECREKIRNASIKLLQTRNEKLEEALGAIQDNIKESFAGIEAHNARIEESVGNFNQAPEVDLSAMENILSLITADLDSSEGAISEKLQELRETVDSVSKSITKKLSGTLSSTERAIQSRESDEVWRGKYGSIGNGNNRTEDVLNGGNEGQQGMSASARLAYFFSTSGV